jgi:hypothetical protein
MPTIEAATLAAIRAQGAGTGWTGRTDTILEAIARG